MQRSMCCIRRNQWLDEQHIRPFAVIGLLVEDVAYYTFFAFLLLGFVQDLAKWNLIGTDDRHIAAQCNDGAIDTSQLLEIILHAPCGQA